MASLNTQGRTDFSDHIHSFLESKFLSRLTQENMLNKFAMKKSLPKHGGVTVKFNRFTNPSANTTALSDGVSPDGINLASTAVSATLAQYGDFTTISDQLQDIAVGDHLKEAAELLAYRAAISVDKLAWDELSANGTQRYADPSNNSSIANVESGTDTIAASDIRLVMKAFNVANAKPFDDGKFKGIINPLMEYDLLSETTSNDFIVRAAQTSLERDEQGKIGTMYGIDLMRSTGIKADGTSTNTYGNVFFSKDGYGAIDLENAGTQMIVKARGSAGSEDPLDQRSTVGYKLWYVAKLLEAARIQVVWAYNAG